MSFNSAKFAAGGYTVTWNSVAWGLFRGGQQSPALRFRTKAEVIDNTNAYGGSMIGAIHLGRDADFSAVLTEFNPAGAMTALFPFGTTPGVSFGEVGVVGSDYYDAGQSLVLTALTGTLAGTVGPVTLTGTKVVLSPNFDLSMLMGPTLREMPILMSFMPILSSSKLTHFTYT